MATRKKRISVYLSDSLHQALLTYQQQQALNSSSMAVVAILVQFFQKEHEVKHYATLEQLTALEGQVNHLTEQVALLSQAGAKNPQTTTVTTVSVGLQDSHQTHLIQQKASALASIGIEVEEDEPDEILYEFLPPEDPNR